MESKIHLSSSYIPGIDLIKTMAEDTATTKSIGTSQNDDVRPEPSRGWEGTLRQIFRYSSTPSLVLDTSFNIAAVSDTYLSFSKQQRDEILHTNIDSHVPVARLPALRAALRNAVATRNRQVIECVRMPGYAHDFKLRIMPIYEEGILSSTLLELEGIRGDRTGCTSTEIDFGSSNMYAALLDAVQDYALLVLDQQGNIVRGNPGAEPIKGCTLSEIVGQHFSIFYSSNDRLVGKPAKELDLALRNGKVEDEGWRHRPDGSCFWANVVITPIYQRHSHVGFLKITRDLTEQKATESRRVMAFEEASKMNSHFLANVSHEIRNPMNGMLLALSLLTGSELSDAQLEYTSIMEDSASVLVRVINDVLDFSKLSSGSFSIKPEIFSVREVVKAAVRSCQPSLKPGVDFQSSVEPDFPKFLRGDPFRLRQVLQNLLGNAVKFTDTGCIKLSTTWVTDTHDPHQCIVCMEVSDTGIGLPDDAVATLFTPFTRFYKTETRRYPGTGLGLSICKSLTQLMGGDIGYRRNPDQSGSIFWSTIKMDYVDGDEVTAEATSNSPDKTLIYQELRAVAAKKHILLVEDNNINQAATLKLLNNLGFRTVDTACNGADAVHLVEQRPLSYDVILMDIYMPVLGGVEATEQIRKLRVDIPIIALTSNALERDTASYIKRGLNDCVSKPMQRQQLAMMLLKWLQS